MIYNDIEWANRGLLFDGHRVYRSQTPFAADDLPAVLTSLPADATSYRDEAVEANTKYYYRIGSFRTLYNYETVSELFEIDTKIWTDSGPGSRVLVGGDATMGFFGELPATDFIERAALSTLAGVTAGTVNNLEDAWLKFVLDGKILFVHKNSVRYNVSWDSLNSANVVYGNKVVTILGRQYKVRLIKGADTDPHAGASDGYDIVGSRNSEWSRLFYPLVIDDAKLTSYDGPKLASYTKSDLGMVIGGNGGFSWCQETLALDGAKRVYRGGDGVSLLNTFAASSTSGVIGWRPCLELIEE